MRIMRAFCLKKMNSIALILLVLCLLTACQTEVVESNTVIIKNIEKPFVITRFDREVLWEDGEVINLLEEVEPLVITEGGNYRITGHTTKGLAVDAEDQNVHLFLDNVVIDAMSGPAIWVRSAGKVVITLMDGSQNILSDYPSLNDEENVDAALFCVSDLTINGNGALEVCGYHEDAIYSKDVLKILGGDIVIRSKEDGIRGSDGIVLAPNTLSVESEQTGILTNNTGKEGKGCIDIFDGTIEVVAGEYGIKVAADIYVENASVTCQGVVADFYIEGNEYFMSGSTD